MSKKIKDLEKEINKYSIKLSAMQSAMAFEFAEDEDFIDYGNGIREPVFTVTSLSDYIKALEKQREFELERIKRKFYNQSWFHVLVTATVTLIATLLAS